MIAENPALRAAMIGSHEAFNSLPLKDSVTKETQTAMSSKLMEHWDEVFSADNPVLACREKLATWMFEFARFQVIILGPAPEEDPTRLRGQPGITGEIKEHRVELASVDETLREEMYGVAEEVTENTVWDWCLIKYWKAYWYLASFDAIRKEFGDYNAAGHDWYLPFKHSQCAWWEDVYRRKLNMPSAFGGDSANVYGIMYGTFMDFVRNGSKYPDLDWREHYKEQIDSGDLKLPKFD